MRISGTHYRTIWRAGSGAVRVIDQSRLPFDFTTLDLDTVADMLGFAACKMIRRIVGFAHVIDFDSIQDTGVRARCEAGSLAMARTLLTHPAQFRSIDDVADALPRMVRR